MQTDSVAARHTSMDPTYPRRSGAVRGFEKAKCRRFSCHEGLVVIGRPLLAAEWDSVRAFVARLERDDLRGRFGCPFDVGDEATLRRFFDVRAGIGEMTWALDEAGAIAGLGHRVMISQSEAEIALIVRSDLKRRGIGECLLRDMLARSAKEGLQTLSALVLWENRAALNLARKIGFVPREVSAPAIELTFAVGQSTAAAA